MVTRILLSLGRASYVIWEPSIENLFEEYCLNRRMRVSKGRSCGGSRVKTSSGGLGSRIDRRSLPSKSGNIALDTAIKSTSEFGRCGVYGDDTQHMPEKRQTSL
jgi:hypothetical protein